VLCFANGIASAHHAVTGDCALETLEWAAGERERVWAVGAVRVRWIRSAHLVEMQMEMEMEMEMEMGWV
jgi:hypothetical protein